MDKKPHTESKKTILKTELTSLIYKKTRLVFLNTSAPSLIIPRNLRELTNLFAFLLRMPNIPDTNNNNALDAILSNQKAFSSYFVDTWCSSTLDKEMIDIIASLPKQGAEKLNKYAIIAVSDYFRRTYGNNDATPAKMDTLLNEVLNPANHSFNLSLGDVLSVLETYSSIYSPTQVSYDIFAVRTMYTIILQRHYYLLLKNIKTTDTLMRDYNEDLQLSNYEVIIGGSFYLGRSLSIFYSSDHAASTEKSYTKYKLPPTECSSILMVDEKIKGGELPSAADKDALRARELLLLSMRFKGNIESSYRTSSKCEHNFIPSLRNKNTTYYVFDSGCLLANIIKLLGFFSRIQSQSSEDEIANPGKQPFSILLEKQLLGDNILVKSILCHRSAGIPTPPPAEIVATIEIIDHLYKSARRRHSTSSYFGSLYNFVTEISLPPSLPVSATLDWLIEPLNELVPAEAIDRLSFLFDEAMIPVRDAPYECAMGFAQILITLASGKSDASAKIIEIRNIIENTKFNAIKLPKEGSYHNTLRDVKIVIYNCALEANVKITEINDITKRAAKTETTSAQQVADKRTISPKKVLDLIETYVRRGYKADTNAKYTRTTLNNVLPDNSAEYIVIEKFKNEIDLSPDSEPEKMVTTIIDRLNELKK